MRKMSIVFVLCLTLTAMGGVCFAQVNNLNEPGSILVFPLVDNINYQTFIGISNSSQSDAWLQCFMVTNEPAPQDKSDFFIHLTGKEPFWWATNTPYNRTDANGVRTQIQSFAGRKGFMFCAAVDNDLTALEIDWDFLQGDATLIAPGTGKALQYNAIPHQGLAVVGDRVLNLDGVEYTMSTSQIMFEGFAEGFSGVTGTLAVANLDIDFIQSLQPPFDLNLSCWNQNEVGLSRHLDFADSFMQYDLTNDLRLDISRVFTPKFDCATSAPRALWAVFLESVGGLAWGSNVYQHPATGVPAHVVLPPVALQLP